MAKRHRTWNEQKYRRYTKKQGFSLPFFVQPLCGGNDRYVITSCGCPHREEKTLTLYITIETAKSDAFLKSF